MEKYFYESPIGCIEIVCRKCELISLKLLREKSLSIEETDFIRDIKRQLEEYFSGRRQKFDIKVNPEGTNFQKKVWKELQKIPYNETRSYSEIANAIGNRKAQRAVGSACNKNPIMIIIPCHRVISKNGNLGGFAYGNFIKQKLINLENNNNKNF